MRIYIYTFIPMAAQSEYILFEYNLRKKETNDNTVVVQDNIYMYIYQTADIVTSHGTATV